MANSQAIDAAKEQFGVVLEQQLERVERLKKEGDWLDYGDLSPIKIGMLVDFPPFGIQDASGNPDGYDADVAKALAMGADAVSIGTAALVALGCNKAVHIEDYHALGTEPGYCHHCHTGLCPVGITTQEPELEARLAPEHGARLLKNYLTMMALEAQTLARACGKSHLHNLEPEDLVALTIEAAAMAGVPLAGTDWIPGRGAT